MPEFLTSPDNDSIFPILLAGGTGTRLWPLSRQLFPKQLIKFIGDDSLIQNTIKRLLPIVPAGNIRIVCGLSHFHEIARHMQEAGVSPDGKIIGEPCGRNTAPAILLAMFNILTTNPDAVLCVFPADHVIRDVVLFREKVGSAVKLAEEGHIVTFGIPPNYPETGYGYIEGEKVVSDGAFTVKRFVEKPDRETAGEYIRAGNFYWNSGMFTFKLSVMMEEFRRFQPSMVDEMAAMLSKMPVPGKPDYEKMQDISIDYAVMEKTEKAVVLPSDFGWSDIGSWKSLFDFLPKNENQNVIDGDVVVKDSRNCFILGRDRLVAVNHVQNIVVVDTPDSVFISDLENSRNVKDIVSLLKENGRRECYQHVTVNYPWGTLTGLEEADGFSVDRLTLFPGRSLTLPENFPMPEHITVVNGRLKVVLIHGERELTRGETISLPGMGKTTLLNPEAGPVNIIGIRFHSTC